MHMAITTLMPLAAGGDSLSAGSMIFLVVAIGMSLAFEFVNGFHDTANAVATVIYTHTLPPWIAVIWSGLCNLTGVLLSSGLVAFSILALLPVELVINVGSGAGFAMIFALLISAILWNLGTWYLGLPASSSHTLIGSIMGVGIANAIQSGHGIEHGINWPKAAEVFTTLLVSPIVGFIGAGLLLILSKTFLKRPELFKPPAPGEPPPHWIRGLLILTCTGVSFAHGSNDGQKGMGLLLLILIGILPAEYALNMSMGQSDVQKLRQQSVLVQPILQAHAASAGEDFSQPVSPNKAAELGKDLDNGGAITPKIFAAAAAVNHDIVTLLAGHSSLSEISAEDRKALRTDIFLVGQTLTKLAKADKSAQVATDAELKTFKAYKTQLDHTTNYLPVWVKVAVAFSLGCGTMIGWKRIVVTVGEKIGKEHLNYGQGASAELVAMATIGMADWWGLPVSTTHVLSSGVAGTMAANHSGLQMATLRNIMMAWVLTLPVCVLLGSATFAAGLLVVAYHLVPVVAIAALGVALTLILRILWRRMAAAPLSPAHASV